MSLTDNVVYNIRLEMNQAQQRNSISVKKGDTNSRSIRFAFTNRGSVMSLDKVVMAVFKATKPDRTYIYNDCQIDGNEIFYTITTQTVNVEGEVECEIQLVYEDGSTVTSPTFAIYVYAVQSAQDKYVETTNEYKGLLAAVAEGNSCKKAAAASKTAAAKSETNAKASEDAAEVSETNAKTSEDMAEVYKENAKASEGAAAVSEANAKASEEAAAASEANAKTSEEAAAASEANAKTSEEAAAVSEANAKTSETAAKASETAAKTSELNAASAEYASASYEAECQEIYDKIHKAGILTLGETHSEAYYGDHGKIAYDHANTKGNPHGTTADDLGLGNVDNTSDAEKPISNAQRAVNTTLTNTIGDLSQTTTTAKSDLVSMINEVDVIAKGRNKAMAYDDYKSMIAAVNAFASGEVLRGQNIYIATVGVPDLWIYGENENYTAYTYTSDEDFTTALSADGKVQIGYFYVAQLETQKVDLTPILERLAALEMAIKEMHYPGTTTTE